MYVEEKLGRKIVRIESPPLAPKARKQERQGYGMEEPAY